MSSSPFLRRTDLVSIWSLAWPLILSNLTVPLVGAVSTGVIGHLDDPAYLGGVALGTLIFTYVYWAFGFLRMGTTGLASQAHGAQAVDEVRAVLARALILAAVFGGLLTLFRGPIGTAGLSLLEGSTAVQSHARDYFEIRILAAVPALANIALLGWFLGLQNTRYGLIQQVVINGINILLSVVLVFGAGLDVEGVAWAAVLGQTAGLVVALVLARRLLRQIGGRFERDRIFSLTPIKAMVAVNRDIFIRTVCVLTGTAFFMDRSAALGEVALAANAVLMVFQTLSAYAMDGFAQATEAIVGKAIGARDRLRLDIAARAGTVCALAVAVVAAAIYTLFGGLIIELLTGIDSVRREADAHLIWAILLPLASIWAFQLDGIFIGATRTAEMRNAMIASLIAFVAAGLPLVDLFGNDGLWGAYVAFMGARAVTLYLYYPRVQAMAGPRP
ncbi:MATE family efflux transporter [Thalassobaculum sp. OXR-137]|uniref:MATE family efflux transporter n=1 Tax=Thalassobaculum sp. OXR-137 TaxID=3100173 RepID=UPI002AC89AD3|nr:MATE family efflux transporter [Thalassobaculum sp. OXR-137]WPZ34945.1 MATE family efflux transporter [Thalassobaculum sp. OXR-137]